MYYFSLFSYSNTARFLSHHSQYYPNLLNIDTAEDSIIGDIIPVIDQFHMGRCCGKYDFFIGTYYSGSWLYWYNSEVLQWWLGQHYSIDMCTWNIRLDIDWLGIILELRIAWRGLARGHRVRERYCLFRVEMRHYQNAPKISSPTLRINMFFIHPITYIYSQMCIATIYIKINSPSRMFI